MIFELTVTDFEYPRLETALPSHELEMSMSNYNSKQTGREESYLEHTNTTEDFVHKSNSLIPSFHEIVLCTDDNFTGDMVERHKQAGDCKTVEARNSEKVIQEIGSDGNLNRGVCC